MERKDQPTYFAKTDHRGQEKKFGIKAIDRTKHVYVIGKTGMGKSTLLENMAAQDILNGNGMAFIDPHGATVEALLKYIPKERIKDVVYFAPFDIDNPISFNIMEDVGYEKRHLVVSGLMSAFKKIWKDQWSSRMEYILTNTLLALVEYPDSTLLDVIPMLIDKDFRKKVVAHLQDPIVKSFWVDEFAKYSDRYTQEATPAIQNKIGQFVSNPLIRNIVGQSKSSFDFRDAMDNKKIIIMNLSKGLMGEQNADLIGSMLVIKIYLAAMSRADVSAEEMKKLPNFYFYVDEFQSFANDTFADILSEARKYKLNLTIAHQYIEQMPDEVRAAVFGNVGTMIFFRVGAIDAQVIEKEILPTFTAEDLVNLGIYQIYLKLMIDGLTSKPFSATTLPPIEIPDKTYVNEVIELSRATYAAPRSEVEEMIKKRLTKESTLIKEDGSIKPEPPKPPKKPWNGYKTQPQTLPQRQTHSQQPKSDSYSEARQPRAMTRPAVTRDQQEEKPSRPARVEKKSPPEGNGILEREITSGLTSPRNTSAVSNTPFKKAFTLNNSFSKQSHETSGTPKREEGAIFLKTLEKNKKKDTAQITKNSEALRDVLAAALKGVESDSAKTSKVSSPLSDAVADKLDLGKNVLEKVEKKREPESSQNKTGDTHSQNKITSQHPRGESFEQKKHDVHDVHDVHEVPEQKLRDMLNLNNDPTT